jgi:alpha-glucosidase
MQHRTPRWWQTGAVYQVYPRSFADADGDGTGDLAGITGRLDYLAWLGVDAIWISPFYPSPMADFGYDVSDYTDVDPLFGTLDDFDALLAAAHQRGLRILIDYVPNHTSDRHPWFVESRSSPDNPRRDWYVWRDAKPDGSPPNNWISMFAGPAWEWDERTGQFYLHTFLPEQPDLNWRNPATRAAMFDVARFWLDRGVDGFRIDVAPMVMKDPELRDNPPNPDPGWEHSRLGSWLTQLHLHDHAHPDMHELYRSFRAMLDAYPGDRVSIGELHHPDFDTWARYYGERQDEIHVPFNFHVINSPWRADAVRRAIEGVQAALPPGAWASWVLGNHDQPRFASPTRAGRDQAGVGMLLLLSLRGTPTIYYGDEIGMVDVPVMTTDVRDPLERREPGRGRDPERSPMQWDASRSAGFTASDVPWLPLAPDADRVNVAAQAEDPDSLLTLTRDLLRLRREHAVLHTGDFERFGPTPEGTFAYRRIGRDGQVTVALNLTGAPRDVPGAGRGRVLIGTYRDRDGDRVGETLDLRPNEAVVIEQE